MTTTTSACDAATQARLPSGSMYRPTGAELVPKRFWKTRPSVFATASRPSAMRLISARVAVSKTPTSPEPVNDTSARFPSGVNLTRIGNSPALIVAVTFAVFVSMAEIVFAPRFVTQTSRPSGVMSTPSAPLPVSTNCRTFPAVRSMIETPPADRDVTYARRMSREAVTMCDTSRLVGMPGRDLRGARIHDHQLLLAFRRDEQPSVPQASRPWGRAPSPRSIRENDLPVFQIHERHQSSRLVRAAVVADGDGAAVGEDLGFVRPRLDRRRPFELPVGAVQDRDGVVGLVHDDQAVR
jgi:hypothetical protein